MPGVHTVWHCFQDRLYSGPKGTDQPSESPDICWFYIFQVTSYLDGSVIYGSSKEESEELRLFTGGLLRVQLQSSNGETESK